MTIQLNPPIEVWHKEFGYGLALLHLDYGFSLNGAFLVAFDETREMRYVQITDCKAAENFTFGLKKPA